jgi:hypothetical protein
MALAVKQNEAPYPEDILIFCANGVMFRPEPVAHLIDKRGGDGASGAEDWLQRLSSEVMTSAPEVVDAKSQHGHRILLYTQRDGGSK